MFPDRVHSPGDQMLRCSAWFQEGAWGGHFRAKHMPDTTFTFGPFFIKVKNPPKISFCLQRQILVFFLKAKWLKATSRVPAFGGGGDGKGTMDAACSRRKHFRTKQKQWGM